MCGIGGLDCHDVVMRRHLQFMGHLLRGCCSFFVQWPVLIEKESLVNIIVKDWLLRAVPKLTKSHRVIPSPTLDKP